MASGVHTFMTPVEKPLTHVFFWGVLPCLVFESHMYTLAAVTCCPCFDLWSLEQQFLKYLNVQFTSSNLLVFSVLLLSFFFPLGSPGMLSILCWWWNCAWAVCSTINHVGGMLWAVTRGPWTSFISQDRPGYVVVTSNSQNQWIKEVMVYFCSCNTSFKGQLGLCSTSLQNPADVTAVILNMKRGIPLTFYWPKQITWPHLTFRIRQIQSHCRLREKTEYLGKSANC